MEDLRYHDRLVSWRRHGHQEGYWTQIGHHRTQTERRKSDCIINVTKIAELNSFHLLSKMALVYSFRLNSTGFSLMAQVLQLHLHRQFLLMQSIVMVSGGCMVAVLITHKRVTTDPSLAVLNPSSLLEGRTMFCSCLRASQPDSSMQVDEKEQITGSINQRMGGGCYSTPTRFALH